MTELTTNRLLSESIIGDHKDRLIDVLQAQLQKVREELSSSQYALSIIKAKLEEARRALDRCMGIRL